MHTRIVALLLAVGMILAACGEDRQTTTSERLRRRPCRRHDQRADADRRQHPADHLARLVRRRRHRRYIRGVHRETGIEVEVLPGR